ncbi:hypothetical protein PGS50_21670, partial [Yersinia intermedia]|nr:hypothetical protein [Yersinia intermedia]
MRLTIPELDYSNGFTTENDIFKRKKLATQLENIILNAEDDSLVFAIDDECGAFIASQKPPVRYQPDDLP